MHYSTCATRAITSVVVVVVVVATPVKTVIVDRSACNLMCGWH